ncbi:hypothetical protein LPJ53_001416 [Coemansia erecta]|uniref:ABC transporter domain-containing protein n=1 Tax=Coemansia erecta TaxID=147472 RepID=A0A9W8CUL5_9FUNG|nr:hypothetical protein LPJ53_001416 [Coemansia erecta]
MSGQFLARLNRNDALVVCSQYARGLVDNSYELLIVVCKEAIKSSVLAYKLIQRFYLLQHIPSGEIELTIMLLSDLFEKIGIVGRTGAGKSSLTYAIMRMVEPASGHIKIDGVDISTIDLQYLRTQISVIPQDPVLFEGTIRDNLDPAHEYSDEQVWSAIHAGQINHLLDTPTEAYVSKETEGEDLYDIDSLDDDFDKGPWIEGVGLNKWVDYGGSNFSIGQRQLVSLCRALLWRRKIVILDEATASMDAKTDSIMQYVIRREFAECTVLTIAHRLNTVMDSDRIIVMDKGQVVEFDTPQNLLSNSASHFAQLVNSMAL